MKPLVLLLLPAALAAQATNPPYLKEMPPVERVLRETKGATAEETAARQMGTFLQFKDIIQDMASYRFYRNQLTADEKRLIGLYHGAYLDIARTRPEYQKFTALKGFDIDPGFRAELFQKYFSPSFLAKYQDVDSTFKTNIANRAKADTQRMMQVRADDAEAQKEGAKLKGQQRGLRRCMEAGLNEAQCISEGVGKSFKDSFLGGLELPGLTALKVSGLRMGGAYARGGSGGIDLKFYAEQVVVGCQDLESAAYQYSVSVQGGQAVVNIHQLLPRALVLTLQPDGRLAGPATVDIQGQVQTGIQEGTRTWSDGSTQPISRPVYERRTRRCAVALLTLIGPSPDPVTLTSAGSMIVGLFMGPSGNKPPQPTEPGLRMGGEYGSQAAFDLEFRPEGVIVGCRDAAVLRKYKVAASPSAVTLTVQHGATPLSFTLGADGQLTGSGTVRVDGRQISNVTPDGKYSYLPRSATCSVGVLAPAGSASASSASSANPASPGNASLSVSATLHVAGRMVPLAQEELMLLNEDPARILTEAGFQAAPGKSLLSTFADCQATNANCLKGIQSILGYVAGQAQTDAQGKAIISGVAPGTYWVLVIADQGPKPVLWSLKVDLKGGQNAVALSPSNATP